MTKPFPECHAQPYTGNKIKRNTTALFQTPPSTLPFSPPPARSIVDIVIPLRSGDGLADAGTALPRVEPHRLRAAGLLDRLVGLGEDELDVAGARHVGVDLEVTVSISRHDQGFHLSGHTRPWAR